MVVVARERGGGAAASAGQRLAPAAAAAMARCKGAGVHWCTGAHLADHEHLLRHQFRGVKLDLVVGGSVGNGGWGANIGGRAAAGLQPLGADGSAPGGGGGGLRRDAATGGCGCGGTKGSGRLASAAQLGHGQAHRACRRTPPRWVPVQALPPPPLTHHTHTPPSAGRAWDQHRALQRRSDRWHRAGQSLEWRVGVGAGGTEGASALEACRACAWTTGEAARRRRLSRVGIVPPTTTTYTHTHTHITPHPRPTPGDSP